MKKILMLMSALMLLCVITIPVLAIDDEAQGSIALTLKDDNGNYVKSGTLTLYKIASVTNDSYVYTSSMSDCDISLDNISDSDLAQELSLYVSDHSITGTSQNINNGQIYYGDLDVGLYLITQTISSDDYYDISPVLISIPLEVDGEWTYDVDASPKVEAVTSKTTTPDTPSTDTTTPDTPTTPNTSSIETTTTTTSSGSTLPQTGMLLAPIAFMAILGLILFGIGWKLSYGQKKSI